MENKQGDASVELDGQKTIVEQSIHEKLKVVIVINNQFTNAPNTTQLASGTGRSSAEGKAKNEGIEGTLHEPHENHKTCCAEEEIIIIINNQINYAGENDSNSSATQVASGCGTYSTSGTNSAIESSNTKQQFSVGSSKDSIGLNKRMNSDQIEAPSKSFNPKHQLSDVGPKLFIP
ncbi:hypothetical protein ACFQZ1_22430 [Bacillus sp. CGMCC 1.60114]|uniref:hypothetical protein n=1 Tax=unclassified Bacillus (in: firmicutes) TaxID=185979 RepID=UPI00363206C8